MAEPSAHEPLVADVPSTTVPGAAPPVELLEHLPAAFALLGPGWRVDYLNRLAERLVGHPAGEVLGRPLWSAVPVLVGTPVEAGLRAAAGSGRTVRFETVLPGVRGRWWEVSAWPVPGGLAVHLVDVSDRRAAEESARRAAARTALLARLAADLSGALDGEAALGRLARLVVPTLADACIVTVVDREGRARDVGSWHADPARRDLLARYTDVRLAWLPPDSPVARALELGTPITRSVQSVLDLLQPGPAADLLRALELESVVVLPLPAESRTVGVLTLYQDPGRVMSEADVRTAAEVAAQAGRAVERVHRHSQQVQMAEALQRSLLTEPPELPGVEVAVRYVPAAEAARVGGDWYDAFPLRDGAPVIVIGDVTGHDTAAAVAMGQLRGLLRGVAHAGGGSPAEVLRAFDEAVVHLHPDTLATAALARIETADDGRTSLRWASAGHPPPVLVRWPDHVELLGGGTHGELLLGVDPTVERTESTVTLEAGDTLVLYTDGLVERRDATLDAGLARLCTTLADLAGRPLEAVCDELVRRMLRGTPQDDVALVALRLAGRRRPVPEG